MLNLILSALSNWKKQQIYGKKAIAMQVFQMDVPEKIVAIHP